MAAPLDASRFRELVEALPDPLLVVDSAGAIVFANGRAEDAFGYARGELEGQPVEVLVPDRFAHGHAALRERFAAAAVARPMGGGRELVARRKNGTEFPVEVALSPLRAGGGRPLLCATVRDVSDRRQFERRLADRVAQMAALVDSVPYPVFVKDAQARFVTCNRAYEEAFPTTRERLAGKTVLDLEYIAEEVRRNFHEEDVEVIRTGGHRRRELPILYQDGRVHTTLYSVDGFRLADGSPGGLIGLLVDISERKLEQARLAEAEERSRLLLESTAEGIFGVDRGGRITFVNPAGAAMLGFAPEELVGRGAHEAVHSRRADGSPYPEAECRMVRALERGEPCRVDDELLWRKDGTGLPVEYRATPMRKGGEVVGAVVSFTDITERKVRDDAFRAVWNMPGEAVVLFDENGFADGNASWLRMMEYDSISEIVGKMPYELSPELQPDGRGSREAGEEFVRQAIADGTVRFEYVHQTRSGRPLPLDIALSATTLNGRPAFVSLSRDLSERNAAQAELKRRAEELELAHFQADTALDLTRAGYWHVPLDGSGWYNSSARAAAMFGDPPRPDHRYRVKEEWFENVEAGDAAAGVSRAEETGRSFQAAVDGEIPVYEATYAYRRPVDGKVVWIRAAGRVVRGPDGKPSDMWGVTQDITEYKRLEAELVAAKEAAEAANRAKSAFLATMSHEIRTPMNAVLNMLGFVLESDLEEKARSYASVAHASARNLLGILNDLLDFSKIEADRLELESAPFSLRGLLEELTETYRATVVEKHVELVVHVLPSVPDRLVGDALRLRQVRDEPRQQRVQVHEPRRGAREGRAGGAAGAGRRAAPALHRPRHRHRHLGRAAGGALPGLRPGRQLDLAPLRRHRARPRHQPAPRAADGRGPDRRERARAGKLLPVHRALPRRGGRGGAGAPGAARACASGRCSSSRTRLRAGSCWRRSSTAGRSRRCRWTRPRRPCACSRSATGPARATRSASCSSTGGCPASTASRPRRRSEPGPRPASCPWFW